ncbi:MAG: hypothetical protein WDZ94_04080 [Patescibacteria group bacterium]
MGTQEATLAGSESQKNPAALHIHSEIKPVFPEVAQNAGVTEIQYFLNSLPPTVKIHQEALLLDMHLLKPLTDSETLLTPKQQQEYQKLKDRIHEHSQHGYNPICTLLRPFFINKENHAHPPDETTYIETATQRMRSIVESCQTTLGTTLTQALTEQDIYYSDATGTALCIISKDDWFSPGLYALTKTAFSDLKQHLSAENAGVLALIGHVYGMFEDTNPTAVEYKRAFEPFITKESPKHLQVLLSEAKELNTETTQPITSSAFITLWRTYFKTAFESQILAEGGDSRVDIAEHPNYRRPINQSPFSKQASQEDRNLDYANNQKHLKVMQEQLLFTIYEITGQEYRMSELQAIFNREIRNSIRETFITLLSDESVNHNSFEILSKTLSEQLMQLGVGDFFPAEHSSALTIQDLVLLSLIIAGIEFNDINQHHQFVQIIDQKLLPYAAANTHSIAESTNYQIRPEDILEPNLDECKIAIREARVRMSRFNGENGVICDDNPQLQLELERRQQELSAALSISEEAVQSAKHAVSKIYVNEPLRPIKSVAHQEREKLLLMNEPTSVAVMLGIMMIAHLAIDIDHDSTNKVVHESLYSLATILSSLFGLALTRLYFTMHAILSNPGSARTLSKVQVIDQAYQATDQCTDQVIQQLKANQKQVWKENRNYLVEENSHHLLRLSGAMKTIMTISFSLQFALSFQAVRDQVDLTIPVVENFLTHTAHSQDSDSTVEIVNWLEKPSVVEPQFITLGLDEGVYWIEGNCAVDYHQAAIDCGVDSAIRSKNLAFSSFTSLNEFKEEVSELVESGKVVRLNTTGKASYGVPSGHQAERVLYFHAGKNVQQPTQREFVITTDPRIEASAVVYSKVASPETILTSPNEQLGRSVDNFEPIPESQLQYTRIGKRLISEAKAAKQRGYSDKEALDLVKDILSQSGITDGFQPFSSNMGQSQHDAVHYTASDTQKLNVGGQFAELLSVDEDGTFTYNQWVCTQYSLVLYTIARAADMNVQLYDGFMQAPELQAGGYIGHVFLGYTEKDEEGREVPKIYEATARNSDTEFSLAEDQKITEADFFADLEKEHSKIPLFNILFLGLLSVYIGKKSKQFYQETIPNKAHEAVQETYGQMEQAKSILQQFPPAHIEQISYLLSAITGFQNQQNVGWKWFDRPEPLDASPESAKVMLESMYRSIASGTSQPSSKQLIADLGELLLPSLTASIPITAKPYLLSSIAKKRLNLSKETLAKQKTIKQSLQLFLSVRGEVRDKLNREYAKTGTNRTEQMNTFDELVNQICRFFGVRA